MKSGTQSAARRAQRDHQTALNHRSLNHLPNERATRCWHSLGGWIWFIMPAIIPASVVAALITAESDKNSRKLSRRPAAYGPTHAR